MKFPSDQELFPDIGADGKPDPDKFSGSKTAAYVFRHSAMENKSDSLRVSYRAWKDSPDNGPQDWEVSSALRDYVEAVFKQASDDAYEHTKDGCIGQFPSGKLLLNEFSNDDGTCVKAELDLDSELSGYDPICISALQDLRKEAKEAKKNMELADKCCKNLSAIVLTKKQKEQEINRIYQVLKEAAAQEILANMDVEQINMDREGIRINTLRNAGIDTVGKVLSRDKQSIQAIEGIGAASAEKILANANAIKAQTIQSAEISFTPENKNAQTKELVKHLNGIFVKELIIPVRKKTPYDYIRNFFFFEIMVIHENLLKYMRLY